MDISTNDALIHRLLYSNEQDDDTDENLTSSQPFDPALILIEARQMSMDTLVRRLREHAIQLAPDFQRGEVWTPTAKCRLIESLLVRIPLPAFYVDATDEDLWLVVDGQQRLTALRDFVVKKSLRLQNLEFLQSLHEKGFDDLPRNFQRRIEETQVTVYLIKPGTPPEVKFNIFKRINTGGVPLSLQEIRHALNQGPVTDWLKQLAESKEFRRATDNGIRDRRMSDRECVLRFCAFAMTPHTQYREPGFDAFLNRAMARLNQMSDRERMSLSARFFRVMRYAHLIFEDEAFRKIDPRSGSRFAINKALFETWSVNLDKLEDSELSLIYKRREAVRQRYIRLMDDVAFLQAISQGTSDPAKVRLRFETIAKLIREVLI